MNASHLDEVTSTHKKRDIKTIEKLEIIHAIQRYHLVIFTSLSLSENFEELRVHIKWLGAPF